MNVVPRSTGNTNSGTENYLFFYLIIFIGLYQNNSAVVYNKGKKRPKGKVQTGPGVPCEAPPNQISKN